MRLVFAGTPEAAVPSLTALLGSTHEVIAVLTRPDARAGRGRRLRPSPVKELASDLGIPVHTPPSVRTPDFLSRLAALAPDACPIVAYGNLIPQPVLDVPLHGWVNLHFSLLPAWRGAAPVQHAIIAGDDVTGATTFRLEAGMDTGPVYGRMTERVRPDDTAGDLVRRLAIGGAELLLATLDGIEAGRLAPTPQADDGVSMAPKLSTDDARIDFATPALAVDRRIRGCTPDPGAWTTYADTRLGLGPVRIVSDGPELAPGQVHVGRREVRVGTATDAVALGWVQRQGATMMPAADWARGLRLATGAMLR